MKCTICGANAHWAVNGSVFLCEDCYAVSEDEIMLCEDECGFDVEEIDDVEDEDDDYK